MNLSYKGNQAVRKATFCFMAASSQAIFQSKT
ncbi:hypothetical protein T11_2353 [Trichinella zimbabwensis]|uniref:Uncharacterized protein n=1 Tax=Trichinella zimbabwensis TaxID=268475 RepID=A0A0V1GCB1_9BILA|nr:hypothetical protein T11_2353 [Trichinella zimbabwensis]